MSAHATFSASPPRASRRACKEGENAPQHCCRGARFTEPADPARALFPRVHATGAIGDRAMTGHAVNEMIQRRATTAGFTPAQVDKLGGHSLRAGFVTEAFRAAPTRTRSCGRPGTAPR